MEVHQCCRAICLPQELNMLLLLFCYSFNLQVKNCLQVFISSYFENNPISQLQIITARDGVANSISPLCGNPQLHLLNLEKCISASGDLSLKVALTTAITSLRLSYWRWFDLILQEHTAFWNKRNYYDSRKFIHFWYWEYSKYYKVS